MPLIVPQKLSRVQKEPIKIWLSKKNLFDVLVASPEKNMIMVMWFNLGLLRYYAHLALLFKSMLSNLFQSLSQILMGTNKKMCFPEKKYRLHHMEKSMIIVIWLNLCLIGDIFR